MIKKLFKLKSRFFWARAIIFGTLFVFISVYGYTRTESIVRGVKIDAEILAQNETSVLSKVKGVAKNATLLTLNGREIFIDKQGNFEEDIAFPSGFSVVTLLARDSSGKNAEKTFELYTKNNQSVAILNSEKNIISN